MAYGQGLRTRVLDAYDRGDKTRGIAAHFLVSESWCRRVKQHRGRPMPKIGGGHFKLDEAACIILARFVEEKPDATLGELRARILLEQDIRISLGALWGTLRRLKLSLKKSR